MLDPEHHCGPQGDLASISDYLGIVFIQLYAVCAQCLWPTFSPILPLVFPSFFTLPGESWGSNSFYFFFIFLEVVRGEEAGKLFLTFFNVFYHFNDYRIF